MTRVGSDLYRKLFLGGWNSSDYWVDQLGDKGQSFFLGLMTGKLEFSDGLCVSFYEAIFCCRLCQFESISAALGVFIQLYHLSSKYVNRELYSLA